MANSSGKDLYVYILVNVDDSIVLYRKTVPIKMVVSVVLTYISVLA